MLRSGQGLRNVLLLATVAQGLFLLFYHATRPGTDRPGHAQSRRPWRATADLQVLAGPPPPAAPPEPSGEALAAGGRGGGGGGGGGDELGGRSLPIAGERKSPGSRVGLCTGASLAWGLPNPGGAAARRLLQGGSAAAERRKQRAAEKARQAALEDERTSVSWRTTWCDEEKASYRNPGRKLGNLPPEDQALHLCLRRSKGCAARSRVAEERARALPSMVRLGARERLPCLFSNRVTCPINGTVRNRETGYAYSEVPFDLPLPDRDLEERFGTCAVVGNGASVLSAQHGAAIDAHDAVFRFNDLMRFSCLDPGDAHFAICGNGTRAPAPPPALTPPARARAARASRTKPPPPPPHLPLSVLQDEDRRYERYTGRRTRFRLFNRKHALKLETLGRSSHVQYRPADDGESFVFWHHGSVEQGARVANEFPEHRMYFLSTDMINWQVEMYSAVRRDLYSLGLGPFQCYSALSSGVHGVLTALQMCDSVDVYGFSLTMEDMEGHVHFRPIQESPSQAHSWHGDMVLLHLLHLAGLIGICT